MNTPKLLVGLPSLNEADSIAFVTRAVDSGLTKISKQQDCLIVNIDSGSTDQTINVFNRTTTNCPKRQLSCYSQTPGKGANLRLLWQLAQEVGAEAVVTVDADLKTIDDDWIPKLLTPIIDDACDYVAPLYQRNRYEGSTTTHLAVPLIWTHFGVAIRQPIGGEFACNRQVIDYFLTQPFPLNANRYGIDIFMTMHALGGGFRVGEVNLNRKFHKPSFPKIMPMFEQVADTALAVIKTYGKRLRGTSVDLHERNSGGIDAESIFPGQDAINQLVAEAQSDYWKEHQHFAVLLGSLSAEVDELMRISDTYMTTICWVKILKAFGESDLTSAATNGPSPAWLLARLFICRVKSFWQLIHNLPVEAVESLIEEQKQALYYAVAD